MKILPYLFSLCAVVTLPQITQAESLDYQAKQELIETLKEILRGNKSRETSAISAALDAFRPAAMDDKAALALYENCIKKKEFTEKDKSDSEWRKWKNDNKEKNGDIAFRKALQYQFQWAVLTLQAASVPKDSFDASKYSPQIISILESIGNNYKELKSRKGELGQSVLQGPVGEVYAVSQIKPEQWPGSLMDVGGIFETLIFPKFREDFNISGLRNAWDKRIGLEARFLETKDEDFEESSTPSGKEDKKRRSSSSSLNRSSSGSSMAAVKLSSKKNTTSKDLTKQAFETLQELRWQKEIDCCKIGDESQASMNMLSIIKMTRDPKTREKRIQELMDILIPSKKAKSETTPFGSTSIQNEEDDSPKKRRVRKPAPNLSSPTPQPTSSESSEPSAPEPNKPIIPIVEEVTNSETITTVEEEKITPPTEAPAPTEVKTPASNGESKVSDDFFDE